MWLPGFERVAGQRSGELPRVPDAPPRCVLHTDEAGSNTRSLAQRHQFPPQLWVNPATRERYQIISLDRTGYALLHPRGTPETNHMGRCVQVEIAGHAKDTHAWPDEWLRWLALDVVRPIHEHAGVPLVAWRDVGLGSDEGYGPYAPTRMSRAAWRTFSGFCTHQNVPDNAHWDAGRFPLGRVLSIAEEATMRPPQLLRYQERWWILYPDAGVRVPITDGDAWVWGSSLAHVDANVADLVGRASTAGAP